MLKTTNYVKMIEPK